MRVGEVFKDADVTDKTAARSYSVGSAALRADLVSLLLYVPSVESTIVTG